MYADVNSIKWENCLPKVAESGMVVDRINGWRRDELVEAQSDDARY